MNNPTAPKVQVTANFEGEIMTTPNDVAGVIHAVWPEFAFALTDIEPVDGSDGQVWLIPVPPLVIATMEANPTLALDETVVDDDGRVQSIYGPGI